MIKGTAFLQFLLFDSVFYCLAPHSGQNFVPEGISFPQLLQKLALFCLAPHSGQNLEPTAILAPQAAQVAAGTAGAAC